MGKGKWGFPTEKRPPGSAGHRKDDGDSSYTVTYDDRDSVYTVTCQNEESIFKKKFFSRSHWQRLLRLI